MIWRRLLIGIALLFGVLIVATIIQASIQPKPYRWVESFKNYDKQPYGSYIFFEELRRFFPGNQVKRLTTSDLQEYFPNIIDHQSTGDLGYDTLTMRDDLEFTLFELQNNVDKSFNFFGINSEFSFPDMEAQAFLTHLYQGNEAIISTFQLYGPLEIYIGTKDIDVELFDLDKEKLKEKFEISIFGKRYKSVEPYQNLSKIIQYPDSAKVIARNRSGDVLGIELPIGKGKLILTTMPFLFSNYYLLKQDNSLAERMVLDLPNRDTYWTHYFSKERSYEDSRSLLTFIHSEESLKWAFYLLIFSILAYLGLQIKRTQRAVPVIEKPENASLKFTQSVSALYLMKKDYKEMMVKKMQFFLEKVRNQYHLDPSDLNKEFFEKLSVKTGVKRSIIEYLFRIYERFRQQESVNRDDFLRFNRTMQNFKK